MKGRLCALLLAAASLAAQPWRPLFDGATLAGWRVEARPEDAAKGFWKAEGGSIVCDSRGRPDHDYVWLMTEDEFGDFELRLEVQSFRSSPGNSGVQVRSRYDRAAQWLDGPQVDIHPPAPWRTGLIYDETRGWKRWIHPLLPDWNIGPEHAPAEWEWRHAGEGSGWNEISILCDGTRIRTTVNGRVITDRDFAGILDDAHHRARGVGLRGHIALQLHTRDELSIRFRNIAVRELRR
ncbi:MAG: DUF1080 domain-containing protein [Bryobacteraceae bacterium]|nr:DUF1080 domain-containing protein [Bryobacteraceae bacterium]